MTINEMLDKLKELYRRQCDLKYSQYENDKAIEEIRQKLINSLNQKL